MVSKVTKYVNRVMDPNDIESELSKAYAISSTGRPGPVWLDIPMNIQAASVKVDAFEMLGRKAPAGDKPNIWNDDRP